MNSPAAIYNRRPSMRGDTLPGWNFEASSAGEPVIISSARAHLRTRLGRLVYAYSLVVEGARVIVPDVPASVTQDWPVGDLDFDIEVTLADGRVRTWITGTQPVMADRTY